MIVFGIGLPKTGTRSLAVATRMLGLRTMHKGSAEPRAAVERAAAEGVPLLTHLGRFDVYLDVATLVARFAPLDEQYPGAKFILTTRDLDGWLASSDKHERGKGRGPIDPDAKAAQWHRHHAAVRDHFAGRRDLLELDIIAGDGWDELAPFLGRRIPRSAFPWENQAGAGTYRREGPLAPTRRRAQYAVGRARRLADRGRH